MAANGTAGDRGVVPPDGVSWSELAADTEAALAAAGVDNAASEARWMVAEVSGIPPGELATDGHLPATTTAVHRLRALVARRSTGEPLAYVLGSWSFRHLDLAVDAGVLIPRPETEQVTERVLAELDRSCPPGSGCHGVVVDLGTGSGAIALSVAHERPGTRVVATDADPQALAVASANLAGLGMAGATVELSGGDWFDALTASHQDLAGAVDVVVANPPYIADDEQLDPVVADHEPRGALVAGPEGTEDLEVIISGARAWLRPGGAVVVECAPHQAGGLADLARACGYEDVEVGRDLAGRQRMVIARQPGPPGR
jgi:release factor glutamine methyltransferase